ncbi:MAG: type 2 glycerol-3-phosphate oxidase [Verrucomicrobia bacterium]|nr:type 2 glycerol-3-phosphate oxidase [Verrucomicrobiota bacterium]
MQVKGSLVFDVVVIGAGVIGAAISRELSKYNLQVAILERNLQVAQETSAGNSGVIHGGFDPIPGTLSAKLNLLGRSIYENEWFRELSFPHKKVDSLVLAFTDLEKAELKTLYDQGITNGLKTDETEILSREQCLELEPNVNLQVVAGFLCTSSHIVDPVCLTNRLVESATLNGVKLFLEANVETIAKSGDHFVVQTIDRRSQIERYRAKFIINAAGHYADVVAAMIEDKDFTLKARRGQYRVIEKTERGVINDHILFMVPTIYGKGVIVAPMLDGHLLVGPTAEEGIAKEETRLISIEQFEEIGVIARRIIPGLRLEKTCGMFSGSRSICVETDDFWIAASSKDQRFIHVAGISSPGLSAAPAIAREVIALLKKQTELVAKVDWVKDQPVLSSRS